MFINDNEVECTFMSMRMKKKRSIPLLYGKQHITMNLNLANILHADLISLNADSKYLNWPCKKGKSLKNQLSLHTSASEQNTRKVQIKTSKIFSKNLKEMD